MAINGLSPWVLRSKSKLDTCLVTPALVYKGSHSSSNLKSLDLHLARRPSLSRWSIQYSPMTVGGRASSSVGRAPPPRYPPPGLPPLEPAPMDMLPAPTSKNLLATAGVGRGGRGLRQPRTPTAPGLCQTRPTAPSQWMPTPGRQEASQATPYRQQVYPP